MPRQFDFRQLAVATMAGALLAPALPASANTLIGFTDTSPLSALFVTLGNAPIPTGTAYESWTQSVAASNVTVEALVDTLGVPSSGDWWITTAVGPAFTSSDIVAGGKYAPNPVPAGGLFDLNGAPLVTLASGLTLDPGTYFLVIGPPSGDASNWVGDVPGGLSATLAPGFSLGGAGVALAATGPGQTFLPVSLGTLDFRITSGAPEPTLWTMLVAGFGLAGAAVRRRATQRA